MHLWTVRPVMFCERLLHEGTIHCDTTLSEYLGEVFQFHAAYDWLAGQMRKRIGKPLVDIRYPMESFIFGK